MKVQIVEDEKEFRSKLVHTLSNDFTVLESDTCEEGEEVFAREQPKLVCLDMEICKDADHTLALIDRMLHASRSTKVVVITDKGDDILGNRAIAHGAFDYLKKPVDPAELSVICQRAVRIHSLESANSPSRYAPKRDGNKKYGMIGECEQMQTVFNLIDRISRANVSVLITGESGTGKELCARSIHSLSDRREQSLVPINCGAIPETLLESELFGYVKGAFTGAQANKKGLIEAAQGGTLFLDEIGDMPMSLQVKLLRFLEDKTYQRLGDIEMHHADVRIIAATNKGAVSENIQSTSLREDLYYRLSEIEIHLPPLRKRGHDLDLLVDEIVNRNRGRFNIPRLQVSRRARQLMNHYRWPGNIRELENKLNRASLTCQNQTIEPENMHLSTDSFTKVTFREARDMFEKEFIANTLKESNFCISDAARNAGLSRPTLYDMMKRHGLMIKNRAQIEYRH